ncbi:phage major capsid protein, partial [Megasphaera sp. AM44-1BH]|uniref:phage major capsid protein n=1 Tax=Megasphaera sp. AM44-1BH TaxID=2292358 RepID=UPI000E4B1D25
MDTILALREKRKNLWDAAKAFLDMARDENGMVSAEDAARYDKMEEDVVNLGKEIDRLERQQRMDADMAKPTSSPITEQPGAGNQAPEKKGRASMAYQKAFWDSIRHKNFIDVQNALSIGTDADGGYLVPDEFEHQLIDKLQEENFFRSLATVIHTSGDR